MENLNELIGRKIRVTDYEKEEIFTFTISNVRKLKDEHYLVRFVDLERKEYKGETRLWRTDLELLLKNEVVKFEGIEYELIREKKKSKPEVSDIFPSNSGIDLDNFDEYYLAKSSVVDNVDKYSYTAKNYFVRTADISNGLDITILFMFDKKERLLQGINYLWGASYRKTFKEDKEQIKEELLRYSVVDEELSSRINYEHEQPEDFLINIVSLVEKDAKEKTEESDISPDLSKVKDEDFFEQEPLNLFIVNWDSKTYGEGKVPRIVPLEFFTEENGFNDVEIQNINSLAKGDIYEAGHGVRVGRMGSWGEKDTEGYDTVLIEGGMAFGTRKLLLINYNETELASDGIDAPGQELVDETHFTEENGYDVEEVKAILLLNPLEQFTSEKLTNADKVGRVITRIKVNTFEEELQELEYPMHFPIDLETIEGIKHAIKLHLGLIENKNTDYEGSELEILRSNSIGLAIEKMFNYDWEANDEDSSYFAKASLEEIWKHYRDVIIPRLEGIEVEMEHKDTIEKIAEEHLTPEQGAELIAEDHLKESPEYYKRLKELEEMGFKSEEEYDAAMKDGQEHFNLSGAFNSNDYELIRDGLETLKNSLETNIESPQFNVGMKRLMKEQVKSIEKLISKIQNY